MKKVWVQIDPEAQKVVPVEPDETMYSQVENQRLAQAYWRKLFSAAPTVPHLEGDARSVWEEDEAVAWYCKTYSSEGKLRSACVSMNRPKPTDAGEITPLYTRPQPIGEIEARAECESCGEKYPIDQVMRENMEGGAMCDKCVIASLQDRLKCLSLSVMSDNAYHDLLSESRAEIEARALEGAADSFPSMLRKMWASHEIQGWLRQLAAQKRAAAGEGK